DETETQEGWPVIISRDVQINGQTIPAFPINLQPQSSAEVVKQMLQQADELPEGHEVQNIQITFDDGRQLNVKPSINTFANDFRIYNFRNGKMPLNPEQITKVE